MWEGAIPRTGRLPPVRRVRCCLRWTNPRTALSVMARYPRGFAMSLVEIAQAIFEYVWPLLSVTLVWCARRVLKSRTASYLAHAVALRWSCRRSGVPEDKLHELIVDAARQDLGIRDPP